MAFTRNGDPTLQPRISAITLGAKDLPAAQAFDEHWRGFRRMESSPEAAFLRLDGTWLGLFGRDPLVTASC